MRHTLKWSFFIGTMMAGAMLATLKLFQPIRYEHLVLFGYVFVASSVIAGYVAHKNLEKRIRSKANGAKMEYAKHSDCNAENFSIAVKKVPVDASNMNYAVEKQAGEYFVPASRLAQSQEDKDPESGRQFDAAERFLNEIEHEEVEKEVRKQELNGNQFHENSFSKFRGRQAKVFTRDGKAMSGKFAGMDTHIFLEDVSTEEKKSLVMILKEEVVRMEVE